jgi:hypothetical protein
VAVIEILKWPLVVLILAGVALFYLLPQIRDLIARITHVKYKDAEATTADRAAVTAQSVAEVPKAVAGTGPHPFELADNPHVRWVSDRIAQNVLGMSFSSPEERDRWIFREGARLAIAVDFEQIYRVIWGSQMELLGAANKPGGEPFVDVHRRYQTAAVSAPAVYGTYSFERWIGFLEHSALIHRGETSIFATDKASLFIQYLVGMHYDLHGLRHDL